MRNLILFITLILSYSGIAQTISGKILKADDGSVLPFCTIGIKNKNIGVTSDNAGNFTLTLNEIIPTDSLEVSHISCYTKLLSISDFNNLNTKIIFLEPRQYETATTEINALSYQTLVMKCIENFHKSRPKNMEISPAFYRQYHEENGTIVFFTDVVLDIKFPSLKNKQEQVAIREIRRSHNYESNQEQHGDHLIDLLDENPIYYSDGTIFNKKTISLFHFASDTTVHMQGCTGIKYYKTADPEQPLETGKLIISNSDFHLIYYQCNLKKNPLTVTELLSGNKNPFTWEMQTTTIMAGFNWVQDSIQLKSLAKSYDHQLINNTFGTIDYNVIETFELTILEDNNAEATLNKKFRLNGGLYHSKYPYHSTFWENEIFPEEFPIDDRIISDLEKKMKIEQQFEEEGKK